MRSSSESRIANRESHGVNGILLLDKPSGLSSNQALQRAKRLFGARKAGHTGSLDPLATGMLPVCFGEATKVAGLLLGSRKAYDAELLLGATTNTDDAEGEVIARRPVPVLDGAAIEAALLPLRGRITQVPPAFSAIKQGGVALYKRARRGESVAVPAREVEVHRLELIGRDGDRLRLHVECGSGTYVRSLARDFGARLGCGAHLTALRRLWVEPFRALRQWRLEELEELAAGGGALALEATLLPIEQSVEALPAVRLDAAQVEQLRHGKRFVHAGARAAPLCRAIDAEDRLVALVQVVPGGEVRVLRGVNAS